MTRSNLVAIGLRAKTGRAIAVVLGGPPESPIVILKTEIRLTDPKVPATAQPYHEVMDLPWDKSQQAAARTARAIERVATKVLKEIIEELRANGQKVAAAGIVGAPDRELARIGNPHIRAHAAEGVLFRHALELGARSNGLKLRAFSDRDFDKSAAAELGGDYAGLKQRLDHLRQAVAPPWRADEKHAAMAAWMVLNR